MRPLSLSVLALLVPSGVFAAPAAVKIAEATVRAEPSEGATSLEVLTAGTLVSISELDEAGWRRVRRPEGSGGWILERALAFQGPAGAADEGVPAAPDLRPRFALRDVGRLAALVQADPDASAAAHRLIRRRNGSRTVLVVGLALSAGLLGRGAWQLAQPRVTSDRDWAEGGRVPILSGLACATFTAAVAWALRPGEAELLDVANLWNGAHAAEPIALEGMP